MATRHTSALHRPRPSAQKRSRLQRFRANSATCDCSPSAASLDADLDAVGGSGLRDVVREAAEQGETLGKRVLGGDAHSLIVRILHLVETLVGCADREAAVCFAAMLVRGGAFQVRVHLIESMRIEGSELLLGQQGAEDRPVCVTDTKVRQATVEQV